MPNRMLTAREWDIERCVVAAFLKCYGPGWKANAWRLINRPANRPSMPIGLYQQIQRNWQKQHA